MHIDVRLLSFWPASSLSCLLVVVTVVPGAALGGSLALALYLLSFWHYYLYWLAFTFGTPDFGTFKREAIAMKTVSVAGLAGAYIAAPLDLVSLTVIAGGILLNMSAAAVLGVERTYYGYEVAGLPAQTINSFPYSLTAHPMILGNVAAFGGTLINPVFREQWWPLASLHVVLNIGLLVMEQRSRIGRIGVGLALAAILLTAALAAGTPIVTPAAALPGLAALACAGALYRCYARRTP